MQMMKDDLTLRQAVGQFDRSAHESDRQGYQSQRAEILKRFPRDKWPDMALEDYALGQAAEDTYCRWLEYKSPLLGGIGGGAAKKHIIFKRRQQEGWYLPRGFSNEREAWDRLRSEFVQAFERAAGGDWDRIDEFETLARGPAMKLKSLHVYFPDQVLPVYSTVHLRHFLRSLGRPPEEVNASSVVALNRFLLAALRCEPAVADWNNEELGWLLYDWRDPRPTRRVLKIEPGRDARFWDDCRREGYICVGWDDVGDLSAFESKEAFLARFVEAHPHDGRLAQARRKGNELWKLRELEPGDLVVANRGIGRVLAVGEVVEPGYRWADERPEGRHTVPVKWDVTRERSIAPQARWAKVTVATVSDALLKTIVVPKLPVVPAMYPRIAAGLERKGQLILYGPPGTGKTYQARRFAVWWLMRRLDREGADAVLVDADRLREAERELSTSQVSSRAWWVVANQREWSWHRLFADGKVEYRYGRLKRNYPLVQRGDLVIGYQSTPDKRVMALARVSRELRSDGGARPTIELEPVERLDRGLTYDELKQDAVLAQSEPMRFNNQGTLFRLTQTEAEHLLGQLAERHPRRAVLEQAANAGTTDSVRPLTRVTFHASYTYEDFIEGFRPVDVGGAGGGLSLSLEDGVFKRVCRAAQAESRPFVPPADRRDQPRQRREDHGRAADPDRAGQARPHADPVPEQGDLQRAAQRVSARHDEHRRPQHQASRRGAATALRVHRVHARQRAAARRRGRRPRARRLSRRAEPADRQTRGTREAGRSFVSTGRRSAGRRGGGVCSPVPRGDPAAAPGVLLRRVRHAGEVHRPRACRCRSRDAGRGRKSTTPSNWWRHWRGSSARARSRRDDRSGDCAASRTLGRVDDGDLPRLRAHAGRPRRCRAVVGRGRGAAGDRGAAAGVARADPVVGGCRGACRPSRFGSYRRSRATGLVWYGYSSTCRGSTP